MEGRTGDGWIMLGDAVRGALGSAAARRAEVDAKRAKAKAGAREKRMRLAPRARSCAGRR